MFENAIDNGNIFRWTLCYTADGFILNLYRLRIQWFLFPFHESVWKQLAQSIQVSFTYSIESFIWLSKMLRLKCFLKRIIKKIRKLNSSSTYHSLQERWWYYPVTWLTTLLTITTTRWQGSLVSLPWESLEKQAKGNLNLSMPGLSALKNESKFQISPAMGAYHPLLEYHALTAPSFMSLPAITWTLHGISLSFIINLHKSS